MTDDGAWNTNVTYNNFNGCEVLAVWNNIAEQTETVFFAFLLFAVVVASCQMMMI